MFFNFDTFLIKSFSSYSGSLKVREAPYGILRAPLRHSGQFRKGAKGGDPAQRGERHVSRR